LLVCGIVKVFVTSHFAINKLKLNPKDKDYQKNTETFQKIKEDQKEFFKKMGGSFLEGIDEIKSKQSFYR